MCSISEMKELPRTIKNIIDILAIHATGGISVWFFKPFIMYPLTLQELGSDSTANLDLFTILLSLKGLVHDNAHV